MSTVMQISGQCQNNTGAPPKLLVLLLLLALWFFGHPYQGLWHDGIFYAVQALARLRPDVYKSDLFFLYGSQDSFTLFSPIYATFIRLLGLDGAMLALLLSGYALWVGAAMLLASSMLRGFSFWLGLVLVVAMSRAYSAISLEYAEPFLTPRLIAEGLTLLSIALLLKGKRLASFAALTAAFTMHPLMALAGAAFVGLYLVCDKPREALVVGLLASALVLLLAWSGVSPFDRLFATMDPEWMKLAVARAPLVFWDEWRHEERYEEWQNSLLLSFSLLVAAGSAANGTTRRAFLLPPVIGTAGLLLFWLGTSLFHDVLLIQLQPWRWLWLTQLFSYLAAAWLIGEFWQRDHASRLLLLGFLTAWLTLATIGGPLAVLVCGLFIWHVRCGKAVVIPEWLARPLYALPFPVAAWWLTNIWLEITPSALMKTLGSSALEFGLVWLMLFLSAGGGAIAVLIFLAVWRYGADHRKPVHLATTAGVVFLLMLSLVFWDRQGAQQRYYAQQALKDGVPSFSRVIPAGAVVYWEDDVQMTWFGLGRASYASLGQTVGLIFNRQTAIEGKRRVDRLAALGVKDGFFTPVKGRATLPEKTFAGLIHVCHDPALGYVILSKDFGAGVIARHFEQMAGKNFYLYDCAYLRGMTSDNGIDHRT